MIPVYAVYPSLPAQKLLGGVKLYPPLSLGAVISYAKTYHDGTLVRKFCFLEKFYVDLKEIRQDFLKHGKGVFLFSNYIWSLPNNLTLAEKIKKWDNKNITVFGGPSIPMKRKDLMDFVKIHPQIDFCVRGEGEVSLAELLECLGCMDLLSENNTNGMRALQDVAGLAFRFRAENGGESITYTQERKRASDLRRFPW